MLKTGVGSFICALLLWMNICQLPVNAQVPPDAAIETAVDYFIDTRLQQDHIESAPQATAEILLRRLTLDLIGRPPGPAELAEFVASTAADKRAQWVDRLMNSPGFVRHQVDELETLLMYPDSGNMKEYLKQSVSENRSWDQIFKDMMRAEQGSDPNSGAGVFIKSRLKDIDKMTNEVSVRFFGVNISCAQCHDHPLVSDWRQEHYYGMKSFFARTFDNGGFVAERNYGLVDYATTKGEQRRAQLMFLTGEILEEPEYAEPSDQEKQAEKKQLEELRQAKQPPPAPSYSRRTRIIDSGLSPVGRQWLARSVVNRLWVRLMGYGLVMPVDQMHSENPSSHPELLTWLSQDLVAHDFDLKRLMRGLVMSRTYSRDSTWDSQQGPRPDDELFAVGRARLLTPYQLGAALRVATLDPESIGNRVSAADRDTRLEQAAQAGRSLSSKFEMPREDLQLSVSESLFLSNNKQLMNDLLNKGLVERCIQLSDDQSAIEMAFQSVLLRSPEAEEMDAMRAYVDARTDRRRQAYEQIVWSLLASTEFRFNY